jgi:membrane protease YdiL (CAAX protease family)
MNVCEKQFPIIENQLIGKPQSHKTRVATPEEIRQMQAMVQLSCLALIAPPYVTQILTRYGFCLYKWMPDAVMNTVQNVVSIAEIVRLPMAKLLKFFPENAHSFLNTTVIAPISEEILFRGIIQEILLKRAPVALLQKINPRAANWLESNINAKIGRVALSTLIFALAHLSTHNCAMSNRAIGVIGLGALLGILVEIKGLKQGLTASIYAHALNNLFVYGLYTIGLSNDPTLQASER